MAQAEQPRVTTWKGRDIRELTRDELLEAMKWAVEAYHSALQSNIRSARMFADLARAGR